MVCMIGGCLLVYCGMAAYPTLEQARELFSQENLNNPNIDMYRDPAYSVFQSNLFCCRDAETEMEKIRMKDFLLTTLTSIVVRVSTNAVDDGTATYPLCRDRGYAFASALDSIGDLFLTNVTDCLSIAAYIDRVHTVPFSESLVRKRSFVSFYSPDPKEREAWLEKRRAFLAREKPIRELQMRVSEDNDNVRNYRRALFMICNSCVLANRKVMDDEAFAAFTNRVVELSKPDESEKRRLFGHLDEVKRRK